MLSLEYGTVPNRPVRLDGEETTHPTALYMPSAAMMFPPPTFYVPRDPAARAFMNSMLSLRKWHLPPDPYPDTEDRGERAVNELVRMALYARGHARARLLRALDEVCDLSGLPRIELVTGARRHDRMDLTSPAQNW